MRRSKLPAPERCDSSSDSLRTGFGIPSALSQPPSVCECVLCVCAEQSNLTSPGQYTHRERELRGCVTIFCWLFPVFPPPNVLFDRRFPFCSLAPKERERRTGRDIRQGEATREIVRVFVEIKSFLFRLFVYYRRKATRYASCTRLQQVVRSFLPSSPQETRMAGYPTKGRRGSPNKSQRERWRGVAWVS